MDAPAWGLRQKHRRYRHNILESPKEAKSRFGEDADKACINHIILDNLDDPLLNKIKWLREAIYRYLMEKGKLRANKYHEISQFLKEQYKVKPLNGE